MNKSEIVFKIEKILKDYSCESSPLKIADIVRKLSQENIYCNRKTVKSNIELLVNAKGEIAKSKKGYYICERQFENGELIFLGLRVIQFYKYL